VGIRRHSWPLLFVEKIAFRSTTGFSAGQPAHFAMASDITQKRCLIFFATRQKSEIPLSCREHNPDTILLASMRSAAVIHSI
jgi:hypothetical protein